MAVKGLGRGRRVGVLALVLLAAFEVSASAARSDTAPPTDIAQAGATKVTVSGDWLAAGAGGVWISDPDRLVIRRLDPTSGATVATIRVPQKPCEAPDVRFGFLWTATCGTPGLARINPATNRINGFVRFKLGLDDEEGSVGAGAGGVWVVAGAGTCLGCRLMRVNPRTMKVVARIPVRQGAATVRVGYGAV